MLSPWLGWLAQRGSDAYSARRRRNTLDFLRPSPHSFEIPNLGATIPNMGIMQRTSLSDALFSKVQQRVLALIFSHPERSFYTSEIVRGVQSGVGAVQRELSKLGNSGLVSVQRIGNQKHYRANREAPFFEEVRSLIGKTVGLTEPIRRSFEPYAH